MSLLLLFCLVGVCAGQEFYLGNCRSATCYVAVDDPGVYQTFYETITEGNVIVYELTDSLQDNPLEVSVFAPESQGSKMCLGASVSVRVNKEPVWSIENEGRSGVFLASLQVALSKIGDTYRNDNPLDVKDTIEIYMSGPSHNLNCNLGISVGKEVVPSLGKLMEYPVTSFRAWAWGWKRARFDATVFTFTAFSFLASFLMFTCRENKGWSLAASHVALAIYLSVFVVRSIFMMMASSDARDADPTPHLVGVGVCVLDFLFLLAVGVFVFGKWVQKVSDAVLCCRIFCCPCRLWFSCLEEQGSRAASISVILLAVVSLFALSAGFYLGPIFLVLSATLALAPESFYEDYNIY